MKDTSKKSVQVNDVLNPSSGKQKVSFSTVAQIRLKGEQARDFGGTSKRLLKLLRPDAPVIAAALVLTVLSTAFAVISPMLLSEITTQLQISVLENSPFDWAIVPKTAAVLGVLYLLSWVFEWLWRHVMVNVAQKLIYELRRRVDDKLSRLPLSFFDGRKTGDVMSVASNDIENIASTVQTSLGEFCASFVTIVGVAAAMLITDPLITLVCIVTIPLGTVITMAIVRASQQYFKKQAVLLGELNGQVEECCTGHKTVKAFCEEEYRGEEYENASLEYRRAAGRAQYASGVTYPLTSFVNELSYIAICLIGGLKVISGSMTLGDIQALIHYSQKMSNPVTTVSNMMSVVQTAVASAERVFDLLDEKEESPDGKDELLRPVKGEVKFSDVTFRYDENVPLIENFSMTVNPGESVAIVGKTGAGKTTLVNLIMLFYETQSGTITIDGSDLRDIKRSSLYSTAAMVLQDSWLFEGTIHENIAYGAKDSNAVSREKVISAAKTAMADVFINSLPMGYDTVVGGDEDSLSQGQKQLLMIARAVISDADILILDEATSNVDTRTEVLIQKGMTRLMKGRTSFIIAHRLSTIRQAEKIIVMENGSIAETGSHDELIKKRGVYFELYNSQFS